VKTNVIHEVLAETQAGKLIFPEVVRRLLEVGVESYFCDLATGAETFYMINGKTQVVKMILPLSPIAEEFSSSDLIAAIREAQADKIRYPEFIKRSAAAGVIAYWAFLTGSKWGRQADPPPVRCQCLGLVHCARWRVAGAGDRLRAAG
jgi:uncharacterized protein YbcV (DUF1398 family)